jgi:hypothetical protein
LRRKIKYEKILPHKGNPHFNIFLTYMDVDRIYPSFQGFGPLPLADGLQVFLHAFRKVPDV